MKRKSLQIPAEIHMKLKMESAVSEESIESIVVKALMEELTKREKSRQK